MAVCMVSGYKGKVPVITRIPPFAVLGLVEAVCGLILTVVGHICRKQFDKTKSI